MSSATIARPNINNSRNVLEPEFKCPVSKVPLTNATTTQTLDDVFTFLGFALDQQRLAQAKVADVEAAQLLYVRLVAISQERDLITRSENYKRYFLDYASIATVWSVIATMYQQVAAFALPDAQFQCLEGHDPPYPDLLPLKIFNRGPSGPNVDPCVQPGDIPESSGRLVG